MNVLSVWENQSRHSLRSFIGLCHVEGYCKQKVCSFLSGLGTTACRPNVNKSYKNQPSSGCSVTLQQRKNDEAKRSSETQKELIYLQKHCFNSNLIGILSAPQNNSLSVKVLYFVDYVDLKKKSLRDLLVDLLIWTPN